MERLTKRQFGGIVSKRKEETEISCSSFCDNCSQGTGNCKYVKAMVEKLAEYEDFEEQDLLMKLKCKVGATLYFPYIDTVTKEKVISEENITEIGLYYRVGNGELSSCSEIGNIIFLTQAEAEEALGRMEREIEE